MGIIHYSLKSYNLQQENNYIGKLLHLADPMLPIGGFSHSNGLETYVQRGIVKDATSAEQFVNDYICWNLLYNDAAFVYLSYQAAKAKDESLLLLLDEECEALKAPKEIRLASNKLAARLIKIFKPLYQFPLIDAYEFAIKEKWATGHYPITYGALAACLDIPVAAALHAFYYNVTVTTITNCVKLVPLGQQDGQEILHKMLPVIGEKVQETMLLDRAMVGLCNVSFDVRCMQHERLYSRLYMS
ncbi:urease accessory protein UreF [Chitinophaga caeni]|uniref:Urease accessory protein UreF n=1 Tax=Chitinophaga caeni TaxID=2029983 RepID=A0A291QPE5_9BACT|nr:urease accessory protein UreF [Chitinophaga caeni]